MAETNLSAVTSSGSQNTTQNPQAVPTDTSGGTNISAVQPSTGSANLDTTTGGVPLSAPALSSVPVSSVASSGPNAPPLTPKGTSPLGIGVALVLFVIAAVMLVSILRGAKNTTD